LEFNRRVLEEAIEAGQPLLERLKFSCIFSTNLDEFFMIRVSGLKQQMAVGVTELSPDGMTPAAQVRAIHERLRPMIAEQTRCLTEEVLPGLEKHGIAITPYRALSDRQRRHLASYFESDIFPVLTPLAVDQSHPFPYISNLSLNLGVRVKVSGEDQRFARVKVPPIVPRLVRVDEKELEFTLLEEVIAANIDSLFPGMQTEGCYPFRVTRDADIEIEEDEAGDLLRMIEEQLRKRRFGSCVRLEVSSTMPPDMVRYLATSMRLSSEDVYTIEGPLCVSDFMVLYDLDRPELKYKPFTPTIPAPLRTNEPIFEVLKRQDVLVHHPYDSFSVIVDFFNAAASDPDVLAIKTTLYRTGLDSPVVEALSEASERGKQVAALVELKARFDEEKNIVWARQLERAGVHVVYGLLGLKTHSKLTLVIRREADVLRRYVHIGTGNYNPATARMYTDLGLLTSEERIGADATDLFNYLTGFSRQAEYRRLLVAPLNLRDKMTALVERETALHREGKPARIIAKINSLTDTKIIRSLYKASQAGVPIDIICRGICTLKPGVPGLSETVSVISVVGRFLEHSRVFYFVNGGEEDVYIGSADWMLRNLDRRVELLAPITDPILKKHLKDDVLAAYLRDNVNAWRLCPDGSYQRVQPRPGEEEFDSQAFFINPQFLS
jgi:polyphosphate kinase